MCVCGRANASDKLSRTLIIGRFYRDANEKAPAGSPLSAARTIAPLESIGADDKNRGRLLMERKPLNGRAPTTTAGGRNFGQENRSLSPRTTVADTVTTICFLCAGSRHESDESTRQTTPTRNGYAGRSLRNTVRNTNRPEISGIGSHRTTSVARTARARINNDDCT